MHTESDTLTAPANLLSVSPQFVCMGNGLPLPEVKTCGDTICFREVVTLTGDMLPRAGRITTRRCGVPGCAVVDNEQDAGGTGGELDVHSWCTENSWLSCFVALEHT